MIKLRKLLKEIESTAASPASSASKSLPVINPKYLSGEQLEDLSFKFRSKKMPTKPGVLSHELITIEVWNTPDGYKESIQFAPYHLIFGESSMAIFDAMGVDETAGLTRSECKQHLDKLAAAGESEAWNGAYVAGLCNWAGDQIYQFFNAPRCNYPGYSNRMLSHESLHMARMLITLEENEWLRINIPKDERWWEKPEAKFTPLEDANEEYFAETLERVVAIAHDRWDSVKSKIKMPPRDKQAKPPTMGSRDKPAK